MLLPLGFLSPLQRVSNHCDRGIMGDEIAACGWILGLRECKDVIFRMTDIILGMGLPFTVPGHQRSPLAIEPTTFQHEWQNLSHSSRGSHPLDQGMTPLATPARPKYYLPRQI